MPTKKEAIQTYYQAIQVVYDEQELRCIRGLNNENEINGRNVLMWHHEAVHPFQQRNKDFNFLKNEFDIKLVSDEILYFTANTFLYLPFINDPIQDRYRMTGGDYIYPNDQNIFSKRYDMYVDVSFEKIYNFWDRIGDLIAACLAPNLEERKVYFSTAIDNVPEILNEDENFKWLSAYRNTQYRSLNDKRRNVVHYFSTGTNFQHEHIFSASDLEKLKKIVDDRKSIPNFLKSNIEDTIEGYIKTLELLKNAQEKV